MFAFLQDELGEDVATANLVVSGNQAVLVRSGEEIIDLLNGGQGVLNILPLSGVKQELDAAIFEFESPVSTTVGADTPVSGAL